VGVGNPDTLPAATMRPVRHWLTTHHPHARPDDDAGWNVYVAKAPRVEPAPGDGVLFYEASEGPRTWRPGPDGACRRRPRGGSGRARAVIERRRTAADVPVRPPPRCADARST
jgi:hypothetical protein